MLRVVRRLLARGHKVRVLGDHASADEIRRAGAEFRPWRNAPNRPDRSPASDPQKDWRISDPGKLLPVLLDAMVIGPALGHAQDVIDEVLARKADVLVASDLQLGALAGRRQRACRRRSSPATSPTVRAPACRRSVPA